MWFLTLFHCGSSDLSDTTRFLVTEHPQSQNITSAIFCCSNMSPRSIQTGGQWAGLGGDPSSQRNLQRAFNPLLQGSEKSITRVHPCLSFPLSFMLILLINMKQVFLYKETNKSIAPGVILTEGTWLPPWKSKYRSRV